MSGIAGQLAVSISERVVALARVEDRVWGLDPDAAPQPAPVDAREMAEAVLRGALLALSAPGGYGLAARLTKGDPVAAGGPEDSDGMPALGRAGLVVWDVASGTSRPTGLLRELFQLLDGAVAEAAALVESLP